MEEKKKEGVTDKQSPPSTSPTHSPQAPDSKPPPGGEPGEGVEHVGELSELEQQRFAAGKKRGG